MKNASPMFWASFVSLSYAPLLHAQPTATVTSDASSTTEEPSCTASLITDLCEYKEPSLEFAVASSGKAHCWGYCNNHPPCNFVVFVGGNPYLGTGTCWLYPDEEYDESAGTTEGCSNKVVSVYDKPVCDDDGDGDDDGDESESTATATSSSYSCTATESPSAIAEVCDYPTPDEDCFTGCVASESAASCLSFCAEADSCTFAVFNPHNPSGTPHASGTCWIYPEGKYDEKKASTCSGSPEQYVYENKCPKPKSASSSSSSSSEPSATVSSDGSGATADNSDGDDEDAASTPAALSLSGLFAIVLAMLL